MKRTFWHVLALLGLLTVMVGYVVVSQDEEVSGFYVANAMSGTLEETGDGVYQLTLEAVPPILTWMVNKPEYFAGGYETVVFAAEWSANVDAPLSATVMLQLEELTLRMTAGMPAYDPMTSTFTLQVSNVEAFPVEEADSKKGKGSGIPEEFDGASLIVVVDNAFDAGMARGGEILEEEGRVTRSNQSQRPGAPRQSRGGSEEPTPTATP